MAILKYRNYDDPIYQKPVQEVNDNCLTQVMLNQILQDMVDTHFQEDTRHGVGLAANQIGYLYSIFLTHISPIRAEKDKCDPISLTFWANASFKPIDEELAYNSEGCFSVPGCMGKNVKRYAKISVLQKKSVFL
jgi:peptide deformylase